MELVPNIGTRFIEIIHIILFDFVHNEHMKLIEMFITDILQQQHHLSFDASP